MMLNRNRDSTRFALIGIGLLAALLIGTVFFASARETNASSGILELKLDDWSIVLTKPRTPPMGTEFVERQSDPNSSLKN